MGEPKSDKPNGNAFAKSLPSNSSSLNVATLPQIEEKEEMKEKDSDSSSGGSGVVGAREPTSSPTMTRSKSPPQIPLLNVNRPVTYSSLQAAQLALQIKELQLQQAELFKADSAKSNGDNALTGSSLAHSPNNPPSIPLPPIPHVVPLSMDIVTSSNLEDVDFQPQKDIFGEMGAKAMSPEDLRGMPTSPLPTTLGAMPEHINPSHVDISHEPELPASYKQRMITLQMGGAAAAPPTPPKDRDRDTVLPSTNTSSRDREAEITNAPIPYAQEDPNARSVYEYPPMTPVTIADPHFKEDEEEIPELPPLPPPVTIDIKPSTSHGSSIVSRQLDPSAAIQNQIPMDLTHEHESSTSVLQRFSSSRRNDFPHRSYGPRPGTGSSRFRATYDRPDAPFGDGDAFDRARDGMLYSSIHRADLSTWAEWPNPNASALVSTENSNLPSWKDVQEGAPTSLPTGSAQMEVEYSLKRLLNIQVFEMLLSDPLGRYRFRDWLVNGGESTSTLDMWLDLNCHSQLMDELNESAEALYDIYLAHGSQHKVKLPQPMVREVEGVIRRKLSRPDLSLSSTQQYLMESMYNNEFQRFVKQKLIEQAEVKLGRHNLANADGLGDCFCLTNPRLPDHPIVLVSDGFNAVTGYPRSQIVGRNCRFLQGPGTSPESVQRIRDALNKAQVCTELLLNYRRDGTPFYCLLCIIPLRDHHGNLVYFIGGQTNVTGVFAENKNLSFLITGGASDKVPAMPTNLPKFSPVMMEYKGVNVSGLAQSLASNTSLGSLRGGAAGSIEPVAATKYVAASNSNSLGARIGRLFKKPSSEGDMFGATIPPKPSQYIGAGAEATLSGSARKLDTQISTFRTMYSKLIVIRKAKREVIFATADLLGYLGLPCSTPKELFSSPLIHCDILNCITAGEKRATKSLRYRIKDAVDAEESLSVEVGLKMATGTWGSLRVRGDHTLRYGFMHMTPLKERDGQCLAYVCIFGPK